MFWTKTYMVEKKNFFEDYWIEYKSSHWVQFTEEDFCDKSVYQNDENLDVNDEVKSDVRKSNKYKSVFSKNVLVLFLISFVVMLVGGFYSVMALFMIKDYEYVDDINNLPEPIQVKTSWGEVYSSLWTDVNLNFVAEYEIWWKVISSVRYIWLTEGNNLWPRDFTLWWGYFSLQENIDKFKWTSTINRFVHFRYKWNSEDFFKEFSNGYNSSQFYQFSNNHVIPKNARIKALIEKVKDWDVIKMKWYLVNATWNIQRWNRSYPYYWNSSTTRTDSWDGACEIIYVTDIKWIKQTH